MTVHDNIMRLTAKQMEQTSRRQNQPLLLPELTAPRTNLRDLPGRKRNMTGREATEVAEKDRLFALQRQEREKTESPSSAEIELGDDGREVEESEDGSPAATGTIVIEALIISEDDDELTSPPESECENESHAKSLTETTTSEDKEENDDDVHHFERVRRTQRRLLRRWRGSEKKRRRRKRE